MRGMKGRAWTKVDANRPMRHCVEVPARDLQGRAVHRSCCRKHDDRARRRGHGGQVAVHGGRHGRFRLRPPARRRGAVRQRVHRSADWWAKRSRRGGGREPADARAWAARRQVRSRDVYVYFDNDAKVKAPFDALQPIGAFARQTIARRRGRDEDCGRARPEALAGHSAASHA